MSNIALSCKTIATIKRIATYIYNTVRYFYTCKVCTVFKCIITNTLDTIRHYKETD